MRVRAQGRRRCESAHRGNGMRVCAQRSRGCEPAHKGDKEARPGAERVKMRVRAQGGCRRKPRTGAWTHGAGRGTGLRRSLEKGARKWTGGAPATPLWIGRWRLCRCRLPGFLWHWLAAAGRRRGPRWRTHQQSVADLADLRSVTVHAGIRGGGADAEKTEPGVGKTSVLKNST